MEYRDWTKKDGIGRDISTSLLGYGCMRFPTLPDGRIDEVRAEKLLNTAREAGVNYFDTAFPYHGGESEPFVGRVIAKWPRESFYLATKLPLWSCKKQFERLGVDYIDFYLLHSLHKARYDAAKEMGIVDWLWEQKAAGRIRNFGFSCHDNAAGFEHILRDQPWDFCQLQYNYLDTDDRAEEIAGDQLDDNLATFGDFRPMTDAENAAIRQTADVLRSHIKIGCTGCRYCMPCPMGVDIPDNFSIWNKLGMFGNKDAIRQQWTARFPDAEKAIHCVRCGKCEAVCPQHLPIRDSLAKLQTELDNL